MMQFFRSNVRWIMLAITVIFVFSIFAGYGSFSGGSSKSSGGDYAVAKVDGKKIMASEIERQVIQTIERMGPEQTVTSKDYPVVRSMVLDQLAVMAELDKEVKRLKIDITKDDVDVEFKRIADQFPTREMFLEQIAKSGVTEAQVKDDLRKQLSYNRVMEDAVKDASADIKEIRAFYEQMKDYYFKKPAGFSLNAAQFASAKAAEAFRAKLIAGTPWDKALEGISSADVKGSTPYAEPSVIPTEQMTGPTEVVKKAVTGKPSAVIKLSDADYLVVLKRGEQKAGVAPFDEVSKDVEGMLLSQERQGLQSQFVDSLRKRAVVEKLDEEFFKPVVEPSAEADSGDKAPIKEEKPVSAD